MKNIPILCIVLIICIVTVGTLKLSDLWLDAPYQEKPSTLPKKPFTAFRQQMQLYPLSMRSLLLKIWTQQPLQEPIKLTWKDRWAQLKEKMQEKVQQFKKKITGQSQKEQLELQEKKLSDARYNWHKIMRESNWLWKKFFGKRIFGTRTKHEQREFNAIQQLLNQYEMIAQERILTDQEKSEIEEATEKMISLAYESEKETIRKKEKSIYEKTPKPLIEKTKKTTQNFIEKIEEEKEKLIHDVLKDVVKKYNLVDYVKKKIIDVLKDTKIVPESQYDHIAEMLIIEAGKKKSSEELKSDWLGLTLTTLGQTEKIHEKAKESIKKQILNLSQEIDEKIPDIIKQPLQQIKEPLQQKALDYIPFIEERLMPILAEELIEQKSKQTEQ